MSRMSSDTFDFEEFMDGYIADLSRALNSLSRESVGLLYTEMLQVMDGGGKVHFIGNGGSAATPSHSAGDWSKELGLPTLAHTDNIAALTAWANDTSYANIFVGQLQTWLEPGDLVVGYYDACAIADDVQDSVWARRAYSNMSIRTPDI